MTSSAHRLHSIVCVFGLLIATQTYAVDEARPASIPNAAVRIQYERPERGDVVTGHGTAFGVNLSAYGFEGSRYLLSVSHNVLDQQGNPYPTLKIEINDGRRTFWSPVRVVSADRKVDICLLEAQDEIPELAELDAKDAGPGETVTLAGSPRGIPVTQYGGTMVERFHDGAVTSLARIEFDHGDSGGPLFGAKNRKIVGIAVAGIPKGGDLDHTVGLFIPVAGIENFMEPLRRKPAPVEIPVAVAAPVPAPAPAQVAVATPVPAAPRVFARIAEPEQTLRKPAVKQPAAVLDVADAEETPATAMFVMPSPEVKKEAAPKKVALPATEKPVAKAPVAPAVAVVETSKNPAAKAAPAVAVASKDPPIRAALAPAVAETKSPPAVPTHTSVDTYVVQAGDTLSQIARRFNIKMKDLVEINGIKDPNRLWSGMKLNLAR